MCHHHRLKGSQVSRESWPLYLRKRKTWRSLDFTIPKRSTKNCQFRTFCFFTFSKFCCIQAYSFSAKALSLLQTLPGRHAIVGRHLRKGTYPKKWIESTSIDINRYILHHSVQTNPWFFNLCHIFFGVKTHAESCQAKWPLNHRAISIKSFNCWIGTGSPPKNQRPSCWKDVDQYPRKNWPKINGWGCQTHISPKDIP